MAAARIERRLAAILAADVVGYAALMERDEDRTLAHLKAHRREFIEPLIAEHQGRVVKLMGDGALVEFASVVDAVRCAVLIQQGMVERESGLAESERICFRIGINLGDVIHEADGDLYGDGVNIAARLEQLAEPGGIVVSGTAYDHLQGKLGLPLDYRGEQKLKNVDRPVRTYRVRIDGAASRPAARTGTRRRTIAAAVAAMIVAAVAMAGGLSWLRGGEHSVSSSKPVLAVLPFANVSGAAADEYYADGVTDDLITDLAKLSGLSVIARNSVFRYKDQTVDLSKVAADLGVRYAVEGSLRRVGDAMRINVHLVDTATGADLWADHFERDATDVFSIEEDVIGQIAAALNVALTPAEQARLARPPTHNLEAYDAFLRAQRVAREGFRPRLGEAFDLYRRATQLDPTFADAFAAQAALAAYVWRLDYDSVLPGQVALKEAYESASTALRLNPELSLPYVVLSSIQSNSGQHEDAIASARKAVALAPGDAAAYAALGLALTIAGRHDEAAEAVETSLRLEPMPPTNEAITAGFALFMSGDNAGAIEVLERARKAAPAVDEVLVSLAAAYAAAGRLDEAHGAAEEASKASPTTSLQLYRLAYLQLSKREDLDRLLGALRAAGVPEWPYGFSAEGLTQVKGPDLKGLVFGRTWEGEVGKGQAAMAQFDADGTAAFRTPTQFEIGSVFIQQDLLCEKNENILLDRPRCGPVYKPGGQVGEHAFDYVYVNAIKLFRFDMRP